MASLSRTVLIIGTLTASFSLAQAGDKAAFNAPLRDAMPDITPIIAQAPEVPVGASAVVTLPVESKQRKGRSAKRIAKAQAAPKAEASLVRDAVPRTKATAPTNAAQGAAEASAAPFAKPDSGSSVDQIAKLESKAAGMRPDNASAPGGATPVSPAQASVAASALSNTEAAFRGPPPLRNPGGPRERGSETVDELVTKHAVANGVPVKLAEAVVRIESRGNAHASNAGALGLMQIKFGTARAAGFSGPAMGLFVADTNLRYGMKILGDAYRAAGGNTCGALMRYQSGHLATHMSRANSVYCSRARAIMAGA